ncbi:hypothetical protein D7X94_08580 [Acutalibacter sp. 1XD8-33]|uniref:hypothetical protein n=1 Tax=Acutalibacter sp. 1XD8-33 TaxID=2320081 RepID=UPI000EA3BA84|nr:hypothetical protein [Acutalibacter sp. 1XD8-33]RKJ40192.1 hypothetical protein D7X94_08580 [Acutalibacter sp. 1XD8-33]
MWYIAAVLSAIFVVLYVLFLLTAAAQDRNSGQEDQPPQFSSPEYMERLATVCEALWQEREEPYILILWWGLDGLRLNGDGSLEWISKRRTVEQQMTGAAGLCNTIPEERSWYALQNCCNGADSRLWELSQANFRMKLQAAQMEHNQRLTQMIGQIQSARVCEIPLGRQIQSVPCDTDKKTGCDL